MLTIHKRVLTVLLTLLLITSLLFTGCTNDLNLLKEPKTACVVIARMLKNNEVDQLIDILKNTKEKISVFPQLFYSVSPEVTWTPADKDLEHAIDAIQRIYAGEAGPEYAAGCLEALCQYHINPVFGIKLYQGIAGRYGEKGVETRTEEARQICKSITDKDVLTNKAGLLKDLYAAESDPKVKQIYIDMLNTYPETPGILYDAYLRYFDDGYVALLGDLGVPAILNLLQVADFSKWSDSGKLTRPENQPVMNIVIQKAPKDELVSYLDPGKSTNSNIQTAKVASFICSTADPGYLDSVLKFARSHMNDYTSGDKAYSINDLFIVFEGYQMDDKIMGFLRDAYSAAPEASESREKINSFITYALNKVPLKTYQDAFTARNTGVQTNDKMVVIIAHDELDKTTKFSFSPLTFMSIPEAKRPSFDNLYGASTVIYVHYVYENPKPYSFMGPATVTGYQTNCILQKVDLSTGQVLAEKKLYGKPLPERTAVNRDATMFAHDPPTDEEVNASVVEMAQ